MTLRTRLVMLASAAVALAVLAASVAAWFLIRGTLMDEVDERLLERTPGLDRIAEGTVRISEAPDAEEIKEIEKAEGGPLMLLQGQPIGVQRVAPDGTVLAAAPPEDLPLDLHPDERGLVDGETREPVLWTATVNGESYRIMSAPLDDEESFLRLVHPLEDVGNALNRMAWLLVGVAGVGIAIAGGAGWVIVRAGLRPVDQLTEAAEQVAATNDLAHRIDTADHKRDEVARLARSVNTMLAALDDTRTEQRQLVENAGHELRTPLATLRNDIGVLLRAEQHPERRERLYLNEVQAMGRDQYEWVPAHPHFGLANYVTSWQAVAELGRPIIALATHIPKCTRSQPTVARLGGHTLHG
jgi:two-component system sensor histidine kinase MprB